MILVAHQLGFGFPGRPVLRDLSLSVGPGRLTALIGPNGAGKSTLLRLCMGLLTPLAGEVRLDNLRVRHLTPRQRAAHLAYVPQRPEVSFAYTVRQVVAFAGYAFSAAPATVVDAALRDVDLAIRAEDPVSELSEGQRQRVAVARALVQTRCPGFAPSGVLLADEPISAMDPAHALRTMELFAHAARTHTVLVVMHDLSLVEAFADDVVVLGDAARLIAHGPVSHNLSEASLREAFSVDFTRLASPDSPTAAWAARRAAAPRTLPLE